MNIMKGRGRLKGASSFKELAHYVTRLGEAEFIRATNYASTDSDDLALAIAETEATQALNTTSKTDKTYHIIVSWRANESVSPVVMASIEAHVAERLGLAWHQRISAVHSDTDNLHMHIAFNLVHPETGRKITPFQDFKTSSLAAREMELTYGLERDNGLHYITADGEIKADKTRSRNAIHLSGTAKLIESHRGIESFQTWLKGNPANAIREALGQPDASWQSLHDAFEKYNVRIQPYGKGLVVVDLDNPVLKAKASQVGRFCSMGALQAQLGPYVAPELVRSTSPDRTRYVEKPSHIAEQARREKQAALYRSYVAEKDEKGTLARRDRLAQRVSEKERFGVLSETFKARRDEIKASESPASEKRTALKLLAMDRVVAEQGLRDQVARERTELRLKHGRTENYRQFVTRRAQEGDEAALASLRGMKPDTQERDERAGDNAIRSSKPAEPNDVIERGPLYKGQLITHQVHRNSDVSYALNGRLALRDEGRVIRIHESKDVDTIDLGLRLAQKKYGDIITLTGDADFKALAVRTAVQNGIRISFADPALEAMRVRLLDEQNGIREVKLPEQPRPVSVPKVVFDVPFTERTQATDLGLKWDRHAKGYGAEQGSAAATQAALQWPQKPSQPEQMRDGEQSPAIDSRSTNAPIVDATSTVPPGQREAIAPRKQYDSVDDFVQQRNQMAEKVSGLLPHRLVQAGEVIDGTLEGIRSVGSSKVALIETANPTALKKKEIVVVPLSKENENIVQSKSKGFRIEGTFDTDLHVRSITRTRSRSR